MVAREHKTARKGAAKLIAAIAGAVIALGGCGSPEPVAAVASKPCALDDDCTGENEICDLIVGRCAVQAFAVDATASLDGNTAKPDAGGGVDGPDAAPSELPIGDASADSGKDGKTDGAADGVPADGADSQPADAPTGDAAIGDASTAELPQLDGTSGCTKDEQCPGDDVCLAGICDSGTCTQIAMYGCCVSGPCCDPVKHVALPLQTPCGTQPVASEWACKGADIQQRQALPGCDGKLTDVCPLSPDLAIWGPWATVSSCAAGSTCQQGAPTLKPVCSSGEPAQCLENLACEDGNACTKNTCAAEKCLSSAAVKGTVCGSQTLKSEYKCSSAAAGGDVLVREAIAGCDGMSTCSNSELVWGAWKVAVNCGFTEVCDVADPAKIGTCVGAPDCKPGSTCCTALGEWAPTGTACGTAPVDTEYQCIGAAGGKIEKRVAVAGCNGYSATCASYNKVWGAWAVLANCPASQVCTESYDNSILPVCKAACTAGTTCCSADGSFATKGTACGSTAWDTETKCSGTGKGAQILERKAYCGCVGTKNSCSCSTADFAWSDWKAIKTCTTTQICEVNSWGDASCVSASKCLPSQSCCTAEGQYAPKTTSCGSSTFDTDYGCSGPEKGGKVLKKTADYGCSGTSTGCSYATADYVWSAWVTYKTCTSTEVCEADSFGGATCVSAYKCTPGAQCCTADGQYASTKTACGTSTADTDYQCSGTGKGALSQKRTAKYGCSGTSTGCSYNSANYVWGPWTTDKTCTASQYCAQSYPGAIPYCTATPP